MELALTYWDTTGVIGTQRIGTFLGDLETVGEIHIRIGLGIPQNTTAVQFRDENIFR